MVFADKKYRRRVKIVILVVSLALSLIGNFFQYINRFYDVKAQENCEKFRNALQDELTVVKVKIAAWERLKELSQSPKWNEIRKGEEVSGKALHRINIDLETYKARRDQLEDKIIKTYIPFSS